MTARQLQIIFRALRLMGRYHLRSALIMLSGALGVSGVVCSVNYGASGTKQILDQIQIDRADTKVTWTLTDVNGNTSAPVTQSINYSTAITGRADSNSVLPNATVTTTAVTPAVMPSC